MPRGAPKIGNSEIYQTQNPRLSSSAEELLNPTPEPSLLGTIPTDTLQRKPPSAYWVREDGTEIEIDEGPAPWEVDPTYRRHNTDARKFVEVPDYWELRWLEPKQIDLSGYRGWQPVMASDNRVKLKVPSLRGTDNTVRRGLNGAILAYMPRPWLAAKLREKAATVKRRSQSARDRQEEAREAVNRGEYDRGRRYTHVDSAIHPTHTRAEGRSMRD